MYLGFRDGKFTGGIDVYGPEFRQTGKFHLPVPVNSPADLIPRQSGEPHLAAERYAVPVIGRESKFALGHGERPDTDIAVHLSVRIILRKNKVPQGYCYNVGYTYLPLKMHAVVLDYDLGSFQRKMLYGKTGDIAAEFTHDLASLEVYLHG